MKYKRFEEIPVWQESREFVNKIYRLIESNWKLQRNFSLVDQLRRAALSILLNIAEGFERSSNKEFANFLNIAKGSAGEVRSISYVILDNGYISKGEFDDLYKDLIDISQHLSNFRKFLLKNSHYKS